MRAAQPPRRRPRARPGVLGEGRARHARRAQIRRRRAALVILLAGLLALAVVLFSGGSHPRAGRSGGSLAAAGAGGSPVARAAPASHAHAREAAELERLIALGKPIYCAAPRGNEVALTFDDGPGPYTRLMVAKLRKHGAQATFFIVGRNIALAAHARGPSILREERALGAVGDHTFTHPLLTSLAPAGAEGEIVRTQTALARASGGPVFLFRPPYGARNARIDAIARAHGLLQILWTVDSADSLGANYAQIERNVISRLHAGAIVLMHENHGQTVRAMLSIFAALKRKHLHAVSVPQLLADDPPSLAQVRAGGAACGVHGALSGG
jgi:peptidoglycan-N-acetylglucosamine deacetylase